MIGKEAIGTLLISPQRHRGHRGFENLILFNSAGGEIE